MIIKDPLGVPRMPNPRQMPAQSGAVAEHKQSDEVDTSHEQLIRDWCSGVLSWVRGRRSARECAKFQQT